ncbi:hypothetical protein HMPREF0216_00172 [Clostridium celatum DSM 1785]|uniref:Uncharacterized protein n=1 Tax=Clostridium celatum DSM 1785 TaxID=545697 RepID=L1QNK9_9CLOT|nr:hypothetical protein HMPREF0216_00172 [Clostridium celatum DSM 1785]
MVFFFFSIKGEILINNFINSNYITENKLFLMVYIIKYMAVKY